MLEGNDRPHKGGFGQGVAPSPGLWQKSLGSKWTVGDIDAVGSGVGDALEWLRDNPDVGRMACAWRMSRTQ